MQEPGRKPHDALFRCVFARPRCGLALVRLALPGPIRAALAGTSLHPAPGEVVVELRSGQNDLVFEVRRRGSARPLLLVLIEHQRRQRGTFVRRMARSALRLGDAWLDRHGQVPSVLPLLVHQAARPWSAPLRLARAETTPPRLRRLVAQCALDLEVTPLDLGRSTPGRLADTPGPRVVGLALALLRGAAEGRDGALRTIERLAPRFRALQRTPRGREELQLLLDYTLYTSASPPEQVGRRLAAAIGPTARDAMKTPGMRLFAATLEARFAEGKAEGKAELVAELLEERFGPLPAAARRRIDRASPAELLRMAKAAPAADRLVDVVPPDTAGRRRPGRRRRS